MCVARGSPSDAHTMFATPLRLQVGTVPFRNAYVEVIDKSGLGFYPRKEGCNAPFAAMVDTYGNWTGR